MNRQVLGAGFWVLGGLLVGPLTAYRSPLTAQQRPTAGNAADFSTSITIYQDSRILVRRTLPIRVPAGNQSVSIPLDPIDPASVVSLDSDVAILGASTGPGPDAESALRASVGKAVLFRSGVGLRDTVTAVIVGVDPVRVKLPGGEVMYGLPGQPTFPADLASAPASTDLRLQVRRGVESLRLGGFAQGGGWNAMYAVILGGATGRVTGMASFAVPFHSRGTEVQLLAGQVNQAPAAAPMAQLRGRAMAAARAFEDASGAAAEQKVGEFHVYTLPGRHDLRPGVMTSVALFDPATAPVARSYEVRSSIPFYGYWGQTGDEGETPVSVFYTLKRERRTPFGDAPLPQGAVRIFQADSAGRLQLVGEAGVGHTAPGEELRINAGSAFDLVAKRVQTDYQTGQEPVPGRPRSTRTFVNAAYADTLRNQGDAEATIDVFVERGGEWRVVESSLPAERVSSTKARFRVKVPARGEAVLTYRIRSSW
jgi:hypothetical protein